MFPLVLTDTLDKVDVSVQVQGGGEIGQSGAIRHGLSNALLPFISQQMVNKLSLGQYTSLLCFFIGGSREGSVADLLLHVNNPLEYSNLTVSWPISRISLDPPLLHALFNTLEI